MKPFSTSFIENRGEPVEYNGQLVWPDLKIRVYPGGTFGVHFLKYIRRPRQLLSFATRNCLMRLVDDSLKAAHFHADSKPNPFRFEFDKVKEGAELIIWNSWELRKGEIEFGLNYSGMIYSSEEKENEVEYYCNCSDGVGEPDFNSLVFKCRIVGVP